MKCPCPETVRIGLKLDLYSSKRLIDFKAKCSSPIQVKPGLADNWDSLRLCSGLPASRLPLYEKILTSFAARSPFEVTPGPPVKASYIPRDRSAVICRVSSVDLTEIHSYLSKAFTDLIILSGLSVYGKWGRYPTTSAQVSLHRPFEPRLVINAIDSSEKAERYLQRAQQEFKAGLGRLKVGGTVLGVQKARNCPVQWKIPPFLNKE